MFKLVVLSCLLTVALAKPSEDVRPKDVAQVGRAASIIAEKTIESHGHSIIHLAAPVPSVSLLTQGAPVLPAASLSITGEIDNPKKSEKVEASLKKLESSKEKINVSSQQLLNTEGAKVLPTLTEPIKSPQKVNLSVQAKQLLPEKSNDTEQGRQYLDKNEPYEQVIIHLPEPGTFSYLAPSPIVSALASPVVPKTAENLLLEKSESRQTKEEKSEEGQIQIPFVHAQLRTALPAVSLAYLATAPGFLLYP